MLSKRIIYTRNYTSSYELSRYKEHFKGKELQELFKNIKTKMKKINMSIKQIKKQKR